MLRTEPPLITPANLYSQYGVLHIIITIPIHNSSIWRIPHNSLDPKFPSSAMGSNNDKHRCFILCGDCSLVPQQSNPTTCTLPHVQRRPNTFVHMNAFGTCGVAFVTPDPVRLCHFHPGHNVAHHSPFIGSKLPPLLLTLDFSMTSEWPTEKLSGDS